MIFFLENSFGNPWKSREVFSTFPGVSIKKSGFSKERVSIALDGTPLYMLFLNFYRGKREYEVKTGWKEPEERKTKQFVNF